MKHGPWVAATAVSALAFSVAAKEGVPVVSPAGNGGTCVDIAGPAASEWGICDDLTTSNGLPSGGSCNSGDPGSGAGIVDAQLGGRGDAFDFGAMFWINGQQVGGVIDSVSGGTVIFEPVPIGGAVAVPLAQMRYDILSTQPVARAYLRIDNPNASPLNLTVEMATNWGSDGGTVIRATQSGDLAVAIDDRWIVTSDGNPDGGDPVNLTAAWGGNPPVQPTSVSTTVFGCAGTEGYRASFPITVLAGGSRAIVTFHRLAGSVAEATNAATAFTNADPASSDLFAGLTSAERGIIANFASAAPPPPPSVPVPVGGWWAGALLAISLLAIGGLVMRRRLG